MPEKQLMAVTGDEMGLAAASKGSASCRAGQCARCVSRPTAALPRGARRCPLPWLSPGGRATLPCFTGCCTDSRGCWRPRGGVGTSSSPEQLPGELSGWLGSSELSHPSQPRVPTLEPRGEREKLLARRGLAGWAPLPWPPPPVGGGAGRGDPRGVPGRERPQLRRCRGVRCRARWSEPMFILIMSSQCIRKLIKSTH